MKKILIVLISVLSLFVADVDGQTITRYQIRTWFGRNNSTNWCYTLTMTGMKLNVGGTVYSIPEGVNVNNYDTLGVVSGSLPSFVSLNFYGKYTCSGSQSGTKTYTVNIPVTNTIGCGGYYSYTTGVSSGHGITFNVYLDPIEIAPLSIAQAPSCMDGDMTVNIAPFVKYAWFDVEAGIWDPSTGNISNTKILKEVSSGANDYPGGTVSFNMKTAFGANYSLYEGKEIVYRGKVSDLPCGNAMTTPWSTHYTLYPSSPVLNGSISSTVPFCSAKPATGTITIPTVTGSASSYVYSVTKLVPRNVGGGVDCPAEVRITYNSVEYCPGTTTYNKTDSGTGTVTFDNLTAGIYQIKVENQGISNPCTQAVVHEIGVANPFTATASPNTPNAGGYNIICYGGNSGQISFDVSNGKAPYSYSINGVDKAPDVNSPPTFISLTANTYTLKVRDNNGCDTDTPISDIELKQTPATEAFSADFVDLNNPTCYNGSNGAVSLLVNYGATPFSYTLNTTSVSTTGADRSPVIGSLSANVAYTIDITDANSCHTQLAPFTLAQPVDISFTNVDKVDLMCNGVPTGSLKVVGGTGGTAPLEYSINNGASYQSDPEFQTLSASTYAVTIRDKNLCMKSIASATITQPSAITFSTINNIPQSCSEILDGVISLSPSTGGTGTKVYSINDSDYVAEASPVQFIGLASGSYTLYTKDAQGCKVTKPYFLPAIPTITGGFSVSHPISCNGDNDGALNLTPGGGTAPYTFKWSTNETTEDIAGLVDNLYSVEIKDSKGCLKNFDYDLLQPAVLTLQPAVQNHSGYGVSCFGSSDGAIDLTVQGGTAPFAYAWSTTSTQEDIASLLPGQYDIHVTDAHGCQASSLNITITQPTPVALALNRFKDISCKGGSDGELEGSASGGVGYYEYSLNGTTWQNEALFTGLNAQSYTVYMRDGNGCASSTVDHTLTEPPLLVLALIRKIDTSCGTANGSAEVDASGGAGNYQYSWHDNTNTEIGTASAITALPNGDYQAITQDGNGCTTAIAVIINDSDGPQISQQLLKGLTCFESNDGAIGISVSAGLPPYTIKWDTQASTTDISNVTGGEHWVEVLDVKGCKAKQTFNVDFPAVLNATSTINQPLCTGNHDGSVTVAATGGNGGYTYSWATGETQPELLNIGAGTYILTLQDSKQCTTVKNIVVTDPPVFVVDAGGNRTICVGQKLTIRAQEDNATYSWTSDKGFGSTSREVILQDPAVYTLHVISSKGCSGEDSFTLQTSTDLLKADFLMSAEAYAGDTVVMVDISWPMPDNIDWAFPTPAKVISSENAYAEVLFNEAGEFAVTLTAHLGECIDSYVKTITIHEGKPNTGGRQSTDFLTRFEIYPNPNDGAFAVLLEFSESVGGRMRMFSLSGNSVLLSRQLERNDSFTFQESLQNVSSGIYLILVEANGRTFSKRVIIK